MNVFSNLRVFGGSWNVKSRRGFNDVEKAEVASAQVVNSDYGYSVCFHMKDNTMKYLALSTNSKLQLGDKVDLETAEIVTLSKAGESDILRVE